MRQIIVKSPLSTGMYKKVFEVDDSDYDKVADVAMEAMTRATEEVVNNCKARSGHNNTSSKTFIKHFFSSFGPIIWAHEKGKEDDLDLHFTTLTQLSLRNAGYGNLSLFVEKCTAKRDKEALDDMDDSDFYEDDEGMDENLL